MKRSPADHSLEKVASGPTLSVTVNLNSVSDFHSLRGLLLPREPHLLYSVGLPRMLDTLESLDIRATFFVVGSDLDSPVVRDAARRIVKNGHEIANHSFRHAQDIREWSERSIMADIRRSEERIEQVLDVRPRGFRAPFFNVDTRLIRLLAEWGYRYDASVFPCPAWFATRGAALLLRSLRGHHETRQEPFSMDAAILRAPSHPYRPSRFDFANPGDRKHSLPIWELPMGVSRHLRIPLAGANLLGLPGALAKRMVTRRLEHSRFAALGLHAADLMDPEDPGVEHVRTRWAVVQNRTRSEKRERLESLLGHLKRRARISTMAEAAEVFDRAAGPPVIGDDY